MDFDFETLRAFIEDADIVGDNIFLYDKPSKKKATDYILYNFRETNGGKTVREFQVDFRIVSPDKLKLLNIKNKLIQLLDFYDRPCSIPEIRVFKMLNGGGMSFDEDKGEYNVFLYFIARI